MMGMNPRQMQGMMRKMGIAQKDLDAVQVIITTSEEELIFDKPQVAKVTLMGQETYQIIGSPKIHKKDTTPHISQEDIDTVVAQTKVSEDAAREALHRHKGDLAATILDLGQN